MREDICDLCQEPDKKPRKSHFLPAGFLRRLRGDEQDKDKNPYLMSLNWVGQTSKAATQPLLCCDCEERFNKGGERWVVANAYNPRTAAFPLRDLLGSAKPILAGPHGGAYNASRVPGVDIEKLVYFGASVVWRATVRSWRVQKEVYSQLSIELKYQEELRLYLLGRGDFPADAVSVVYVSPSPVPPLSAAYPERLDEGTYVNYRFYVPGLWFQLVLGEQLIEDTRNMCILRSPFHPLCLYIGGDALVHAIELTLYMKNKRG